MDTKPLISIIIPTYNAAKFVHAAYSFVRNQDIDLPLEVIFVDNNSTDNSLQIIQELAGKNRNVYAFSEPKQGAAAARNKGLKESKGDFIYFYDVDDQLFRDTLKNLCSVLLEYEDIEAVFGKMLKTYKGVYEIDRAQLQESEEVIIKKKPFWGIKWFKDLSSVVGPPAFLYRRAVFDKIGNYEENLYTGEDTALDIKLGMACEIAQIDKYVYVYLKHSNSTTDRVKKKKSRNFMQWPRMTQSHLPFYVVGRANKQFGEILYKKLFSGIAKMIVETAKLSERKKLKEKLLKDIKPIQAPLIAKYYFNLLVVLPNTVLLKVYLYKVLPKILKKIRIKD